MEFLSCDWGTTSFRLRLVSLPDFKILAEESSKEGIASTFEAWGKAKKKEEERFSFYRSIIKTHLNDMVVKLGRPLDGIPLIVSGMASSSIGMIEMPYKTLPFSTSGADLETQIIEGTGDFNHEILIISGARTQNDIMRGEETQLVGCFLENSTEEQIFIHPGTHCKHIIIRDGKATTFRSYMTGELFSLLSTKSILAVSVEKGGDLKNEANRKSFENGVRASLSGNLLHSIFMVRTNDLFRKSGKVENYFFLSGLLIGTELKDFPQEYKGKITLSGQEELVSLYLEAFRIIGIAEPDSLVNILGAEEATLRGQFQVYSRRGEGEGGKR